MARASRAVITVCPPNLDRCGFLALEQGLAGQEGPTSRDWLLERMSEGMQVRMLRDPLRGFIEFSPGRSSWRPLLGADSSIVVQRLWVEGRGCRRRGIGILLGAAEDWARYYGFSAVLLPCAPRLVRAEAAALAALGYQQIDATEGGVTLWARVLQGPMALPRFPQNWGDRARRLGPGLVVQSAGRCEERHRAAIDMVCRARKAGLMARLDRLISPETARDALVTPGALSAVVVDGRIVAGDAAGLPAAWQEFGRWL